MYLIDVLIEHPVKKLDHTFTYLSKEALKAGVRVRIPFRNRMLVGYVMDVRKTSMTKTELEMRDGFTYQYLKDVIDERPLLTDELMALGKTMAKMTISPLIACYATMLPSAIKPKSIKQVGIKTQKAIRVIKSGVPKTKKQREALHFLESQEDVLLTDFPYSKGLLDHLRDQGFVTIIDKEIKRAPVYDELKDETIILTPDQKKTVQGVLEESHTISLIHGVTGSGKTEVYLALAAAVLKQEKTVLMLVPEIALTPMMVNQFKSRFHEDVAILHSRLSQGEKYDEYRRIIAQDVKIVVGARSAVFAPLDHIGLIIMDEEHDGSYKQDRNPRYHTLDIARIRADYHHAKIVLGSATPRLETYARAQRGIYGFYEMNKRINQKPLPQVELIDMMKESEHDHHLMSRAMRKEINACLSQGQQVILLLNKRGYASFVKCPDCQEILKCPHCDVSLTYHKNDQSCKCHYCGFTMPMPRTCPTCQGEHLKKIGYGTQRIEEEINETIPFAKVIRYDYDTTRQKNEHAKLLKAFENKEANILLGTQMIAKGLDFPDVTFVGVLMADLMLSLPDFRASEKTFALLTQVAGRSGRSEHEGKVMIQTFNPTHYAIEKAAAHDYQGFYETEMAYRHQAVYPPFCHLVVLIISGNDYDVCRVQGDFIHRYLEKHLLGMRVIGPASFWKINDVYRGKILVKYTKIGPLYEVFKQLDQYYTGEKGIQISFDFNPNQI